MQVLHEQIARIIASNEDTKLQLIGSIRSTISEAMENYDKTHTRGWEATTCVAIAMILFFMMCIIIIAVCRKLEKDKSKDNIVAECKLGSTQDNRESMMTHVV